MKSDISKADIANALLEGMKDLGYTVKPDMQIGLDAPICERDADTEGLP